MRRVGALISAAGHFAVLAAILVIFGQAKPFEAKPPEAIAVDLVTPGEAGTPNEAPAGSFKQEAPQPASPQPQERESAENKPAPPVQKPQSQRQAAAEPPQQPPVTHPPATEPPPEAAEKPPLQIVPSPELLALYNIRPPGSGFDAPSDTPANLTQGQVAQFKAHLRRCWQLPEGVGASSSTRVVLRISLTRAGALAAEPMLVEGSASREGPLVLRAALRAVEQCQPFAFLPRDRYGEWRSLDVSFSPRDMGGG